MNPAVTTTGRFTRKALLIAAVTAGCACSAGPTGPGGNGWIFERLASGSEVGFHSSCAVTGDGTVHVAYHDAHALQLFHARRTGPGAWIHTRLDTIGWMGEGVTIAAGVGDTLYLAYMDMFPHDLRFARFDGENWEYERLDPFQSMGEDPHLYLAADSIHIIEMNTVLNAINYWRHGSGGWELAGYTSFATARPSFAFCYGPAGPELAAFVKSTASRSSTWGIELRTADAPDGRWLRTIMVSGLKTDDFYHRSLVMGYDAADRRHLLYRTGECHLLDLYTGRVVDSDVGEAIVRICRDAEDHLWILYLRDASLILSVFNETAGRWEKRTAVAGLHPAGRWGFAIDDAGVVHLSVYSAAGELWYGRWEGGP